MSLAYKTRATRSQYFPFHIAGRIIIKILDSFFVLRPTLWFPVWTLILAGATGAVFVNNTGFAGFLTIAGLCSLMGAVYLVNQVKDRESDSLNDKLHFIPRGIISPRYAVILTVFLILTGILFLVLESQFVVLFTAAGIVLVTGILYNLGRIAWKNSPWLSLVTSIIGGAGIWLIGWFLAGNIFAPDWLRLIGYVAAFNAVALLTTIPDLDGDKKTGKITLAVAYGIKPVKIIAMVFCSISFVLAYISGDTLLSIASGISLPIFLGTLIFSSTGWLLAAIKLPILILSILVGMFYYPAYLAVIVIYYIFARIYYKARFNLSYPAIFYRA